MNSNRFSSEARGNTLVPNAADMKETETRRDARRSARGDVSFFVGRENVMNVDIGDGELSTGVDGVIGDIATGTVKNCDGDALGAGLRVDEAAPEAPYSSASSSSSRSPALNSTGVDVPDCGAAAWGRKIMLGVAVPAGV